MGKIGRVKELPERLEAVQLSSNPGICTVPLAIGVSVDVVDNDDVLPPVDGVPVVEGVPVEGVPVEGVPVDETVVTVVGLVTGVVVIIPERVLQGTKTVARPVNPASTKPLDIEHVLPSRLGRSPDAHYQCCPAKEKCGKWAMTCYLRKYQP